jgi:hypothetical protein
MVTKLSVLLLFRCLKATVVLLDSSWKAEERERADNGRDTKREIAQPPLSNPLRMFVVQVCLCQDKQLKFYLIEFTSY